LWSVVEDILELLFLLLAEPVREWCCWGRADGGGLGVGELRRGGLSGLRVLTVVEVHLPEAIGGDGDGGEGAAVGEAVATRGAAVDEGVDIGEHGAGGIEQVGERHDFDVVDVAEHVPAEGFVFFERATPAAAAVVGGAETVAAFGDAAAIPAVFVEVSAFLDHGISS